MTKTAIVLSFIYACGQITLGLLLHPYQTMQSLVRDRFFVWMTLLPSLVLALVTIVWKFLFVPGVRLIFSCQSSGFAGCQFLPFISNWLTFFCLFWQVMLLYLLFRFSQVFRD